MTEHVIMFQESLSGGVSWGKWEFRATCSCEWHGDWHEQSQEAESEAEDHELEVTRHAT